MANPTTYFAWVMPNSADLVTDLPADFAVFGQGVDTSMSQLLGGTTGQVLSKTSGTNMAFTWINNDTGDITGVTAGTGITGGGTSGTVTVTNDMATTITTNGDLIYGTGSGTYTRRAIGSTSQVLTVAGGIPTWATPSAGSLTLLSTTTLSGASTTISSIDQTYEQLYIVITGYTQSTAANNFRMNLNGSTTLGLVMTEYASAASSTVTGHANAGDYRLTNQSPQLNTSANNIFVVTIYNYASTTGIKTMNGVSNYLNSSSSQTIQTVPGFYNANTAVTSITFEQSNGAVANAGTIKIYGVK